MTVERDILHKIHLNSLLLSLCSKLSISLKPSINDINFYAKEGGFLSVEDIESIAPIVKDYQDQVMSDLAITSPFDKFPCSLTMVLEMARTRDRQGKRSQWFMVGGDERVEASELYRVATNVCEQIYGSATI